jgi:hypothetical protein
VASNVKGYEIREDGITMSWINRWKNRHNISSKVMSGEAAAVKNEIVSHWHEHGLRTILQQYKKEDI